MGREHNTSASDSKHTAFYYYYFPLMIVHIMRLLSYFQAAVLLVGDMVVPGHFLLFVC